MAPPEAVVFDLGGVLLDWNPRYLYRRIFAGDEAGMEWFLSNVCTPEWNATHDAGRPFADGVAELLPRFPEYASHIRAYDERWPEMVAGEISGTVEILEKLYDTDVPLYALTNWSHEKYEHAARYPFMALFKGIVVSGLEGVMKPDPAIFRVLLDRYALEPGRTLYIDDVDTNVRAAEAMGFHVFHFTGPDALADHLADAELIGGR